MKVDLLCIAQLEHLTIRDWCEYHLNKGINHIWIYDNNSVGDNRHHEILNDLIEEGKVTIFDDYRGSTNMHYSQMDWHNNFLIEYQRKGLYNYIGIIDCDEYIILNEDKFKTIPEYFEYFDKNCKNIGALFVNWKCYGDNGNYFYEDKPVIERFKEPLNTKERGKIDINRHIKSFLRVGVYGRFDGNPHNIKTVKNTYNTNLDIISRESPLTDNVCHENMWLNHYVTKSMEEFVVRKYNSFYDDIRRCPMNYYFQYNDKNEESLKAKEALEKKYNITLEY